ncbi:MAG: thermonuclease family protein [Acidobacteria bacterium]|nr:thermonuclease family protein [Acidobacteriota bacterium]
MRRYRPRGLGEIRLGRGRSKIALLILVLAVGAYRYFRQPGSLPPQSLQPCAEQAGCFTGIVTKVVDGDTLDINNVRVRLVLVDAPERDTREGSGATAYLRELCPEGSSARLQQDRLQPEDQYGRTLGVVWCGRRPETEDAPVNVAMIRSGHAQLYRRYCRQSEFGSDPWAIELGCR